MYNQEDNTKGALKHSAVFKYRSKSKDKLPNGKMTNAVHSKYTIKSRVPRIVKSPSNTNKSTDKIAEKLDKSGDNKAGTSKTIHFLSRRDPADKRKPSHIPRRKAIIKEAPIREISHPAPPKKKAPLYIGERNVQRVQMLINQDYHPEENPRVESVARPIPTLGNIYARAPNTESGNINDWFVDIRAPANSMASNILNRQTNETMHNKDTVSKIDETAPNDPLNLSISPHKNYASTDKNSDWITSDMEYPTRDIECACRTPISPAYEQPKVLKPRQSHNKALDIKESTSERIDQLIRRATEQKEVAEKDSTVSEQPTVVLAKVTPTLVLTSHMQKTDTHRARSENDTQVKKCQYPSNFSYPKPNQAHQIQHTVPSYVECLSEILQKTTNFEGDGCAGTPNSLSSIAGTDLEIRDELSSECTLDDCSMCDHAIEWCHKCGKPLSDKSKKEQSSETTSIADSTLCQYNDESLFEIDATMIQDSVYDKKLYDSCPHYYCSKKHNNSKGVCEKCEQFKRFPSCRYKDLAAFTTIRGRISLRICRRRLSRVWKKTTERWAMWSAKPPQRFKKHRIMRYLQRTAVGEDADVQTKTFIFKETGTDSMTKERKSQAIAALSNLDSSFSYKSEAGTDATVTPFTKNKGRNCNLGPSLFPFFYNPERNAIIKQTIKTHPIRAKKAKSKSKDKETQKTENTKADNITKEKHKERKKESEDPESLVQICEITVDDKVTGTEDMPSMMQEQMTSTLLHLDSIRMVNLPSHNANTQMWIVCNDAGTNVRYPYDMVLETPNAEKAGPNKNVAFLTPSSIDTEMQAAPLTTEKQSAGIDPSTSHQLTNSPVENNQVMFIPVTPVKTIATTTSRKEYIDTGLMVYNSKLNSAVCLTPPSLQICHCPIAAFNLKTRGTDTDEIPIETKNKSATKLKTYANTGLIINAIGENTVLRGSPKFSIFTDTKSIGNKYTSDIGICTNTILKDSVIETEKELRPERLSASTNTFMKQESKFTEQNSSFAFEDETLFENGTQCSYDNQKNDECKIRRSDCIGDSYLMSVRTLSRSVEEMEVQTELVFTDHGFFEVPRTKCSSSVSTSYAPDEHVNDLTPIIAYKTTVIKDQPKKEETQENSPKKSSTNLNIDSKHKQLPEIALSSALDAVKWIHAGYPDEIEQAKAETGNATNVILKDTKSVDITTQSGDMSQSNELNPMAQETIDYVAVQANAPGINVPPVKTSSVTKTIIDGKSDSKIVCSTISKIEQPEDAVESNIVYQLSEEPEEKQATVQMVDGVTSDVLVKDVKEITLQARPESCDAATECFREKDRKSACALTSRCILPGLPYNCCENHKFGDLSGDCRFVYGIPHCVVHTHKPEEVSRNTQPCHTKQCVQAAGLVITGPPYNQAKGQKAESKEFTQFQCSNSQVAAVSFEENNFKSEGDVKCSCLSKPSATQKQISRTLDDLPTLSNSIALNTRLCTSNYNKPIKTINNLPTMIGIDSTDRPIEPTVPNSQTKPSSNQSSRKALNSASAKTSIKDQHSGRSIAVMTSTKPAIEQHTSCKTGQAAHASEATSINHDRFGRNVGLNTSCCRKNSATHKQTSQCIADSVSNATSINEDHLKRTIGFTTSNRQAKPSMCQKHTSNIYTVASAKTSVQQQMNQSIGLITSRQTNPPIHNKACSNIIKYATAKTSMYDELNTQSIGVVNSNFQDYFGSETSSHLEEHCVQSVGLVNTAWKGKPAVKARSPHAFVDTQSSEFGFLLSPKEYEALYKTTRYLSKEVAKATTAIKEENLGYQHLQQQNSCNQSDAAVEVMLRAEMRSAQNMTSPVMHSAIVMTAPSAVSSEFDSSSPPTASCSEKYPLEIPTRDNDNDNSVKSHLAASCRYYSTLLTKQLDNVKENLTKHLVSAPESPIDLPIYRQACTMKPSAREEFACQTLKERSKEKPNVLDPADNETDICRHDKEHLQSVYYMLTAIEGRLRRLKSNVEYNS